MADSQRSTPMLDELKKGPWPSFVTQIEEMADEGKEECDEKLRLLVRTASNGYFPQVVSALSIPDPGRELLDAGDGHPWPGGYCPPDPKTIERSGPENGYAAGRYGI